MKKILRKLFKKKIKFKFIGDNVQIMGDCKFSDPGEISIGSNVYVGPRNTWFGFGGIIVEDGTIFAHDVEIITRNHNYDSNDLKSIPYDTLYINKPFVIKENVWIGSHVYILPGITIGEGAVIGMGSVLTKDVPSGAVVGGNPAKILKYRDMNKYNELKNENKIYLKIKYDR